MLSELLVNVDPKELWRTFGETIYMVGFSTLFTALLGLPLGILVVLTSPGHLLQNRPVYQVLSVIINIFRSLPFVILMIMILPFTKFLVGTSLGVEAAIPPLVIGSAPFLARLVEVALREVDRGVIEMSQSMGATTWQIITRVMLPEARPAIIAGITITTVGLVGYSAMAGILGAGGLGDLAIRYGYQRFQTDVMIVTVVIIVALVQVIQMVGDRLVLHFTRK